MLSVGKDVPFEEYGFFTDLLDRTKLYLEDVGKAKSFAGDKKIWANFEDVSVEAIRHIQREYPTERFSEWDVEYVPNSSRFPDITTLFCAERRFGVEVKTSQSKGWKTLGGSIMEGTKVEGVERISVLFAKANPFTIIHKPFEECVCGVSVTHSPRYLLDMSLEKGKDFFTEMGKDYFKEVRNHNKPFDLFRKHFEDKAQAEGTELWFLGDKQQTEEYPSMQIKFFSELDKDTTRDLMSKAMLMYPQVFSERADYKAMAIWLLKQGIVNTALRDTFSAGSRLEVLGIKNVPRKFNRLRNCIPMIKEHLNGVIPIDVASHYKTRDPEVILKKWKADLLGANLEPNEINVIKAILDEAGL